MKARAYGVRLQVLLCCILIAACSPAPAPVDSITTAPYYQDPALLDRAWQQPVATTYPNPIDYQVNGAFCGPAAVVNLFQSLGIDQYNQDNLFEKAEVSYWKARVMGLTLDELAGLIRANAALEVTVLRDLTREAFRAHLRRANDPAYRYLINFSRQPLFGVDIGHHSPLGGYLEESDLVFVLDVLEVYQPFLVSADRLYAALDTVDSETGQKRGLLAVRAAVQPVALPLKAPAPAGAQEGILEPAVRVAP
jgi:Phytochelatin synthase